MKKLILSLSALAFATAMTVSAEEVTLSGKATCAKCDLKEAGLTKCKDVLQVTKDGKTTTYDLVGDKAKAFHKEVCSESKEATVTGTVSEKDGKKAITVAKIEAKK